jgi:hypothetical protein
MQSFLAASLIIVSTLASPFANASPAGVCSDLFKQAPVAFEKIYPLGVDASTMPGGFMQMGYESEYLFSESAAILRDYAPSPTVMSNQAWMAMTGAQHIAWLKERFQDKPAHALGSGLYKIVDTPYMPKELLIDATGNVEIVLAPIDTYGEWAQSVDEIVARYGVGSQQAMISKPREAAFSPREGTDVTKLVQQSMGWLVFTNLRDMFAKLQSGAARYQNDPSKLSAQFLDHPFLGPMTKLKRDVMEKYMNANVTGGMYDPESVNYVRKRDASFKYTGGPSYRPDVASPTRFAWEIRNAHKDVADLKMKVRRDLLAHERGLKSYQVFAGVPAFDTIELFQRFSPESQAVLIDLFPSKADRRFQYPDVDIRALESYRNFALPLQDFSVLSKALLGNSAGQRFMEKKIAASRLAYINGVHQVAVHLRAGSITRDQAKAEIMGLVCKWSVESGLTDAFDVRASIIGHEPLESDKAG